MEFEQIYKTYYLKIFTYVMSVLHDKDWAEDVTQDVFFKAFLSIDKFQNRSSEYTWIYSIAKNKCIDEIRKKKDTMPLIDEVVGEEEIPSPENDNEKMSDIFDILNALEEPYKEVFNLRIFGNLSFKKIGSLFGKTESWARVTYHRARIKIQERM